MNKRNSYFLAAVVFGLSFTVACSKNLMPPEGLDATASVGSQMSQPKESGDRDRDRDIDRGDAGSGFNIQEQDSGISSGFLTEESVGESARSGGFITNGPDDSGGGPADRFDSEPFLGDDSGNEEFITRGPDDSGSGGQGFRGGSDDEARRQDFKSTISLQDIYFKFDRYDLDDESRDVLSSNASYLKGNPSTVIEIQGHCDERGTNNYNIALGERRAQSTKMYLVSQGVSARRIHTISYGEERPFCFDSNDACWFKNRRAHFRISK